MSDTPAREAERVKEIEARLAAYDAREPYSADVLRDAASSDIRFLLARLTEARDVPTLEEIHVLEERFKTLEREELIETATAQAIDLARLSAPQTEAAKPVASDGGTITNCPHGCGGILNTASDASCPSCRRDFNVTEIAPVGACWEWFGPAYHRMRCRKVSGHSGQHCEHADRCGAHAPNGYEYCGFPPDHTGPHAWMREEKHAEHLQFLEAVSTNARYSITIGQQAKRIEELERRMPDGWNGNDAIRAHKMLDGANARIAALTREAANGFHRLAEVDIDWLLDLADSSHPLDDLDSRARLRAIALCGQSYEAYHAQKQGARAALSAPASPPEDR